MKKIYVLLLTAMFCGSAFNAMAQPRTVTGTVLNEFDQPFGGVNVNIKETTIGVMTGSDGKYSIRVRDNNDILVFSYVGYITQEIPVNGLSVINVIMHPDSSIGLSFKANALDDDIIKQPESKTIK
jgi:hypothetical protein